MRIRLTLLSFAFVALVASARAQLEPKGPDSALRWREWSPEVFAEAKRDHKLVLLDLEAVWCHWCHVMDATTYRDATIVAQLRQHFIVVRVDQDARPDLATRYQDYGWPATVLFATDGAELRKRRGYIPPDEMQALLNQTLENPTTEGTTPNAARAESPASSSVLAPARRIELLNRWRSFYDTEHGGWGFRSKFLDWDNVELALRLAAKGDAIAKEMALTTLRLQRERLLDPIWGGVYQYSVGGDWNEPHFEKLIQFQAENIRICARAYLQTRDITHLNTALAIHRYVRGFLTGPHHTVYVSQDADLTAGEHSAEYFARNDSERRKLGVPRIDRHIYSRENGGYIVALCDLYAATGDKAYLDEAIDAARWIGQHRSLRDGGFRHDELDVAGPYLADTLAMGRAFLALHQVTQDSDWLRQAAAAIQFIEQQFAIANGGFASSDTSITTLPAPRPDFDENVALARFAAAFSTAAGTKIGERISQSALRWLLADTVVNEHGNYVAGLLLAEEETRTDPLHVTIVARKSDDRGRALFAAALRSSTAHKLVEWWDPAEPPPRGEAIYPDIGHAAAFLCSDHACSPPMSTVEALAARINATIKE